MKKDLLTVKVNNIEIQGNNIALIDLSSIDKQTLPKIKAGAHIDVHLKNGLIRQYSLCHNPISNEIYRIGVLKEENSRGGSLAIHELEIGDHIKISYPKNLFELNDTAKHSILIGGGIGITPVVSMAYSLKSNNESFEIHYCSKDRNNSAFVEELEIINCNDSLHTYFKAQGGDHRASLPTHLTSIKDKEDTHIYICGPEPFMNWVIEQAQKSGFPHQNIHKEYFHVEIEKTGDTFEIIAQKSGVTIQVAADESIVDALTRNNINVTVSCEHGICGACLCDVIEGIPDHRDLYLTDEEKAYNDLMAICCSRSKSERLILDI